MKIAFQDSRGHQTERDATPEEEANVLAVIAGAEADAALAKAQADMDAAAAAAKDARIAELEEMLAASELAYSQAMKKKK